MEAGLVDALSEGPEAEEKAGPYSQLMAVQD